MHFKVLGEEKKKFVFAEQRRLMLCWWMECDSFTGDTSHYLLDPVLIATAPKSEIRQLPPVLDCHFWKFILYISPCKVSYCSPEWVFNQAYTTCAPTRWSLNIFTDVLYKILMWPVFTKTNFEVFLGLLFLLHQGKHGKWNENFNFEGISSKISHRCFAYH